MLTSILGLPLFPWTNDRAFAMHDANEENFRYLNHFFANNQAQTVREYDEVQRRYQGIPWVNSIAADSTGEAYYSMEGAIPNVPNELAQRCNTELGQVTFEVLGLPTLDGSRSECDWRTDPDAVAPGIFGPSKIPRMFRRDYTHNGNDSHWLSNPHQPLEGFDRIVGDERSARSLRTRIGIVQADQRLAGADGRGGNKFTLDDLKYVTLSNRQYAGELWRDPLVEMCRQSPIQVGSKGPVNVSEACPILAAWDVRDELDSRGALLFRRFATRVLSSPVPVDPPGGGPFARPYDPNDPVNTPSGLNTLNPQVRAALPDAVQDLRDAGIPLDAPLRDHQYDVRGTERVPIHGGPGTVGVFNAINVQWKPPAGYGNVPHGSSFVMATQFTGGPCPVDLHTFVTYGESEDPTSPHHADYTRAFSRKEWHDTPFCESDIRQARLSTTRVGVRPTGKRQREGRRSGRRGGRRSPSLTG
jgi:acyl-homoserine-lactone acylase